jgi:co-chaperonin GroES (HSP10)
MEPLFDRVKFTVLSRKDVKSEILHTEFNAKEVWDEGLVTSIGPEVNDVKVGDRIKFTIKKANFIKENDIDVGIVPVDDILLIIHEDVQKG